MTATSDYYETYWSADGFCPTGALSDDVRRLFERHVRPEDACLDVGCGDGRTAGFWLSQHAGQYTGVDISRHAVEMGQAAGLEVLPIDDAASLPFDESSFDFAVCLEVLEHLFDPHAAVLEIARVLRPGGTLLVTVPNVAHWKQRVDLALRGRWNPRGDELSTAAPWRDPHVRFFTPSALQSLLEQSGFDEVAIRGRQGSIARNFRHLERYGRVRPGPVGRWLVEHVHSVGAGLSAIARTSPEGADNAADRA